MTPQVVVDAHTRVNECEPSHVGRRVTLENASPRAREGRGRGGKETSKEIKIMAHDVEIARVRAHLRERDEEYERANGTRASLGIIRANQEWFATYERVKTLERANAKEKEFVDQCGYYQKRKRARCLARKRDGGEYCTAHKAFEGETGEALETRVVARELDAQRESEDERSESQEDANERVVVDVARSSVRRKKTNVNRRMKKMTNPLAGQFQTPKVLDDAYWSRAYDGTHHSAPLLVDIGTAKGGFIKALATDCAEACSAAKGGETYNLLGVEIFELLVDAANAWVSKNAASLKRKAHFVSCNANVSLRALNLPNLRAICIQFPDPWSNKPKRRVVTPAFVDELAAMLPRGGELYCCSDVKALAEEMYDIILASSYFTLDERAYERVGTTSEPLDHPTNLQRFDPAHKYPWTRRLDAPVERGDECPRRWLRANPYAAHTERDVVCELKWRPVYRFAFAKTSLERPS